MSERKLGVKYAIVSCLDRLRACDPAIDWVRRLPVPCSVEMAWARCHRPDWLLWLIGVLAKTEPYYNRAGAAAIAACIDIALENGLDNDDAHTRALALDVSVLLDRLGQTGRSVSIDTASVLLERRVGALPEIIDELVGPGIYVLCPKIGWSIDAKSGVDRNYYITHCGTMLDNMFKSKRSLARKMADEIRRVCERPTLEELGKATRY